MRRWVGARVVWTVLGTLAATPAFLPPSPVAAQAAPVCGNATIEAPETCDDGNAVGGDGCSAVCQIEDLPPDCSHAQPSQALLWPPNHKLVSVSVQGVTDPDGDPVLVTITGVAQDEPLAGAGDGDTCPDAAGVGTPKAQVRAERSGEGDGRVYHVSFTADDGRGGACTGEVAVCVRHDQRPGGACGDQGPLVDSTGGAACEDGTCEPEDCAPPIEALAPPECVRDQLPSAVERRVLRARDLLGRMARLHGRGQAHRLGLMAARQLRKAAGGALRAAGREELSPVCAEALRERLEQGGSCAVCSAG